MKKAYSKPEIIFDDFSLATTIAAGCEKQTGPHEYSCPYQFGDINIFVSGVSACTSGLEKPDGFNGWCYHNPDGGIKLFNSL